MNQQDKLFDLDSDKELQVEYRNLKMTEIPDLWDEIEGNLAPREVKKRKQKRTWTIKSKKRWSAIMAVVILAMLAMPVLRMNIQKQNKNDTSQSAMDKAEHKIVEDTQQDSAPQEMEGDAAPQNPAQNTSPKDSGGQEKSTEMKKDPSTIHTAEVQLQVLSLTEQDKERVLTAEILADASGLWEVGTVLTIICDDEELENGSLKGILQVRLQEAQGIIKIVEILP